MKSCLTGRVHSVDVISVLFVDIISLNLEGCSYEAGLGHPWLGTECNFFRNIILVQVQSLPLGLNVAQHGVMDKGMATHFFVVARRESQLVSDFLQLKSENIY